MGRKARNAVISQYFQLFGGRGVLSTPLKMLTFTWCWPLKPRFRLRPFETTVGLRLKARICRNPACACRAAVTCRASQRAQIVRPRRKFGEVPDDLIANHEPCGARTIEPGIGTDLPRRIVVWSDRRIPHRRRSSSARDRREETNAGERPVRARTISCREECVDDNVGIERRFKGFFK